MSRRCEPFPQRRQNQRRILPTMGRSAKTALHRRDPRRWKPFWNLSRMQCDAVLSPSSLRPEYCKRSVKSAYLINETKISSDEDSPDPGQVPRWAHRVIIAEARRRRSARHPRVRQTARHLNVAAVKPRLWRSPQIVLEDMQPCPAARSSARSRLKLATSRLTISAMPRRSPRKDNTTIVEGAPRPTLSRRASNLLNQIEETSSITTSKTP